MKIAFAPQRSDDILNLVKAGDVLTINGEAFDFSGLPDGATIPAGEVPSSFIVGPVHRIDGDLHITIMLPCRADAPEVRRFAAPIINPADGSITLPGE